MDSIISGVVGGLFGPPVGGWLGRMKNRQVLLIGLIFGSSITMALVISKVARLGGFSEFMRAEAFKISSAGFADLIVAYLFFPVLCVAIMYALKLMSPAPAWRDVELELKKNGFIREMSGDGDFILFKKEKDILRGRVGLRGNPTRLEWFKSGHFKQMINLRAE